VKAYFIHNGQGDDLTGYDVIVCAKNFVPAQIRSRPDVSPDARLFAYTNATTLRC